MSKLAHICQFYRNEQTERLSVVALHADCLLAHRFVKTSVLGCDASKTIGVLIVVGGRQYRVGAHRQFVSLARALAAAGYPAFRFDVRGTDGSQRHARHFLDCGDDLQSAIATLRQH